MIAVIADDLTGAAEMGGLGLQHGLSAEVQTHRYVEPRSDLVVFDTNSRSMRGEQAQDATRVVAGRVREADLLYKKVDSVMRGNILAELETLLITLAGTGPC